MLFRSENAIPCLRLEATRIDHQKRLVPDSAMPVMPVPGKTRLVSDQCIARAGNTVEERRLSDIRPSDDDQGWKHANCSTLRKRERADYRNSSAYRPPFVVWASKPLP